MRFRDLVSAAVLVSALLLLMIEAAAAFDESLRYFMSTSR